MERITLQDFIKKYWNAADVYRYQNGMDIAESIRQRENKLRKLLPQQLVRRLDAGFARSSTVHPDTGHALYTICRASQATHVFETGTYWGYSTAYLAAALEDARASGKVHTFDIYPHAGKHIPKSLRSRIELYRGRASVETMPTVLEKVVPDVFFQDSRHDYEGVTEELKVVIPYLKPGAVILFHDFVEPNVRQAAIDVLAKYNIYVLELQDPQQLGVAIKNDE
jgi:predicted O-methyltransferase YrrM